FSGCLAASRQALGLHPHCWLLYRASARALAALGDYDAARRQYRRAAALYGAPQAGLSAEIAGLEASAGDRDRARRLLGRLDSAASRVAVARVQAALGNREQALDCLEQAFAARDWEA